MFDFEHYKIEIIVSSNFSNIYMHQEKFYFSFKKFAMSSYELNTPSLNFKLKLFNLI